MINLLPDSYKQALAREHRFRLFATNCLFFCYLAVMSLVLFFPSYVVTRVRTQEVVAQSQARAAAAGSSKDVSKTVQDLSVAAVQAREMLARPDSPTLYDTLRVLRDKPDAIRITEISYVNRAGNPAQITFNGISKSREGLTSFDKFLSAQKQFTAVDVPISNFAKESNFEFSATAQVTTQP